MAITVKHAYDKPDSNDGRRILVDRLWPRGLSKEKLKVHEWLKEISPTDQLRKAYHKGEMTWGEFRNAYLAELKNHREEIRPLAEIARKSRVTLVFSSRERERNNAVVLMQYLKMLGAD